MRNEICQYCGTHFANEGGYEHHLKPDFGCMTDKEIRETLGFIWTSKGWKHDAPVTRRHHRAGRPPDLFDG